MKVLSSFILVLIFSLSILSCHKPKNSFSKMHSNYEVFSSRADSVFVSHFFKALSERDWYVFRDYSLEYNISNDDIELSYPGVFYDKDKKKMIVWVCLKMLNAKTISMYSSNESINRICPAGRDTVYHIRALIGFREAVDSTWKLYPFLKKSVSCYSSKESAIKEMRDSYFHEMKDDKFYGIVQAGSEKGNFELVSHGYNVQDPNFWEESSLWKRDTVGSTGLYPFQIKGYGYGTVDRCCKCADELKIPIY